MTPVASPYATVGDTSHRFGPELSLPLSPSIICIENALNARADQHTPPYPNVEQLIGEKCPCGRDVNSGAWTYRVASWSDVRHLRVGQRHSSTEDEWESLVSVARWSPSSRSA